MKYDRARLLVGLFGGLVAGVLSANGCSGAVESPTTGGTGGNGGSGAMGTGASASTASNTGGASSTTSSTGGQGAAIPDGGDAEVPDGALDDAPLVDVFMNPCNSACGPTELCDTDHLGLDDDCDGQVDEGCACAPGETHPCFKGDPFYHGAPGCFDGSEVCGANGQWGPCVGGVHAVPPDNCFLDDTTACHAITSQPFVDVDLKTGTGIFSNNAVAGSEVWTVTCPPGVNPCPGVTGANPADDFKPLQSGEYTVTYEKSVAGQPQPQSCTYPLIVGARGLRVELTWEHTAADTGVDLDLHVHQPNNTQPWGISPGVPQDCTWSNCTFNDFQPPQGAGAPKWFADPPAAPPTAVNWYLDPVLENNTCYYAPAGVGSSWQFLGMGCHNPRLDSDLISCDALVSDPDNPSFCRPENINIDYPSHGEWTRIAVHYYSSHGLNYDVHPIVKVFCDGALAAELGPAGYYVPTSPVTFSPSDGSSFNGNRFWEVADVAFTASACGTTSCTVKPLYSDPNAKSPWFTLDSAATTVFAPAYPPPP